MESRIKQCAFIVFVLFFVQSCSFYSFKGSIPSHIDSIYISPIINNSKEYIVLDVFNNQIYDTFLKENVLKLKGVNDANSRLDIVILNVTDKPFSYTIDNESSFYEKVDEWRITIKVKVEWTDINNDEPLFSRQMTSFGIYSPTLNYDISNDGIDNDQDGLFDADDEDEVGLARDSALIIASRKTAENIISAITSTW